MLGQHASGAHQPKHRPQDQQVSLNLMALCVLTRLIIKIVLTFHFGRRHVRARRNKQPVCRRILTRFVTGYNEELDFTDG
jgi:hypothetical protein